MADAAGDENIEESNDVVEEERTTTSASVIMGELNLVMMVAFLTLSADEISRLDEEPEKDIAGEEHNVREMVSKLQRKRRRQPDDFKAADRQAVSRSQAKIVDSRHGRKM